MVEMQFGINIVLKVSYSFRYFQSDGDFIPDPRHSDRVSTFVQVKYSFRNNNVNKLI